MSLMAIYARYSSYNQREASIENQVRICRVLAEKDSWTLAATYTDYAISGASLERPGYVSLVADAARGRFDIVGSGSIAPHLPRSGACGALLQDDAVSADRHPGGRRNLSPARRAERLKGTMNAIFLQDLRQKVHRRQEVLFCRVQAPAA
jgi:site-specific DNA recombinase